MGTRPQYRRFTADGRILEGTGSNYYATKGIERFTYDADRRLVRIDSEERPQKGTGGLVKVAITLLYDDRGLLAREQTTRHEDGRFPVHTDRVFHYDGAGLLVGTTEKTEHGRTRRETRYEAERAVRHEAQLWEHVESVPRLSRWIGTRDGSGRLLGVQYEGCYQSTCGKGTRNEYSYDSAGRLVRDALVDASAKDYSERATLYTYDPAGRLVRKVNRTVYVHGRIDERGEEYRYDRQGRLASALGDGKVGFRYEYKGACAQVRVGPELPSVESLMGNRVCLESPVRVLSECFEPRKRAIPRNQAHSSASALSQPTPKNFGEGTAEDIPTERWVDFRETDIGFTIRFPEKPLAANMQARTFAWGRTRPYLALYVEVYPPGNPAYGPADHLAQILALATRTEEEGEWGDVTSLPAWLKSKKNVTHQGHLAMDLEGEYAAGAVTQERIKKKGRIVVVGRLVYFVSAMFTPNDPPSARAADYFLSTFQVFPGKNPDVW